MDNPFDAKRVTVMGLGRFGGGVAVTRFLAARGARVTVSDAAPAEKLADSVAELAGLPVTLHLGGHAREDFTDTDLVVVSPAVPKTAEPLAWARDAFVPLTAEMNLFFKLCPAKIVGVTGSSGKSTTTSMIHAVLAAAAAAGEIPHPRVWLGGNIGISLIERVDEIAPDHLVVLELSSFQLEDLGAVGRGPQVGVITNFAENHLDRHGTMHAYIDAKLNILRFGGPDSLAVLCAEDTEVLRRGWSVAPRRFVTYAATAEAGDVRVLDGSFRWTRSGDEPLCPVDAVQVPGRHNRVNAAAAVAVGHALGASPASIDAGLRSFAGLPHRLQLVATVGGVRWYNDSIATTPDRTITAIQAFDEPLVLILGGWDGKHSDFTAMGRLIAARAKAAILIGESAARIEQSIRAAAGDAAPLPPLRQAATLPAAVPMAAALAAGAGTVVLTPACASYDQFANFEQRGRSFAELVATLPNPAM